jgi:hypothetical protein
LIRVVLVVDVRFSNAIMGDINGGPTLAVRKVDIEDYIEDRADQSRLSNAGIPNENDAESRAYCESFFNL